MKLEQGSKVNQRLIWIEAIRFIAIFAVVVLHSASPLLSMYPEVIMKNWYVANIYDSVVRMGVPLFFMISGFLLLRKYDEDNKVFFTKRIHKVIIPMLAWAFIYILFIKYVQEKDINIIKRMIVALNMYTYYHLWFLYTLLGLYLVTPFLRIIIKYSSKKLLYYFLGLWLIHVFIIPMINKLGHVSFQSHLPIFTESLGYFVLGYVLANFRYSKKIFYIALLAFVISTISVIMATYIFTINLGAFDSSFYGAEGGFGIIQAISTFIMIKYSFCDSHNELSLKSVKIIKYFSTTSFGIYLIHPIFIAIFEKGYFGFIIDIKTGDAFYLIPTLAILTFVFSSITVYMMQKIPYIKNIVP